MWTKLLFFLPFFMFSGIAGQLLGLTLFFILFGLNCGHLSGRKSELLICSLLCFVIWVLFPIWNLFHHYFSPLFIKEMPLRKLLASHIPSSCLMTALAFLMTALSLEKKKKALVVEKNLQIFFLSLLLASFVLLIYVLFQHYIGFDYRYSNLTLPVGDMYDNDKYRAYGFYGHPLSLASVCLALFTFCLSLYHNIEYKHSLVKIKKYLLLCSVTFFLILFFTGSRAPAFIGLMVLLFFSFKKRKLSSLRGKIFTLTSFSLGLLLFYFLGLFSRVYELSKFISFEEIKEIPRFIFWKVHFRMFLDRPFFGYGFIQTKSYFTNYYYDLLGLSDYFRKYSAHNFYLQLLVEVGIFGFFLLSLCLAGFLTYLKKLSNNSSYYKALIISLFVNFIHGLTQNTFFDANVVSVYFYLVLVVIIFSRNYKEEI